MTLNGFWINEIFKIILFLFFEKVTFSTVYH
jgi:hypothetical protein